MMHVETSGTYHRLLDQLLLSGINTDTLDLAVLTYMLRETEHIMQHNDSEHTFPLICSIGEIAERRHRVVSYSPSLSDHDLPFVGFIGKRWPQLPEMLSDRLSEIDQLLIQEFSRHRGLLSYSSLELSDGNWCNLVVFKHGEVKEDILATTIHRHAAYELAPQYYQWIRLHHGVIPQGNVANKLRLNVTKYYTFHAGSSRPTISIHTHEQPAEEVRHVHISPLA